MPELQASPDEISINKCITAATIMQGPVIVKDTILGFNSLNGLPGPYIKTFIAQVGLKGLIKILSNFENKTAQASCTFAYTEGPNKEVQLFTGSVNGKIIVPASFTEENSWDNIFQPTFRTLFIFDYEYYIKIGQFE
ncbi:non-canonical purine NTP pyrophosphatase [Cardinium endosymbiont of Tipula unca]|uniref:non-canonical purine NTP pyrophosphatase n=1 Tax=Cardinium endosymbiont of Tipula unca TaxID=3066216 RepID=UPI0030CCCE4F